MQVVTDNINHDKDVVVQKLRNTAVEDESCGQVLVVEREKTIAPKKETTIYAIATNIVWYIVWYSGLLACSGLSEVNGNMARKHADVNDTEKPLKKLKMLGYIYICSFFGIEIWEIILLRTRGNLTGTCR